MCISCSFTRAPIAAHYLNDWCNETDQPGAELTREAVHVSYLARVLGHHYTFFMEPFRLYMKHNMSVEIKVSQHSLLVPAHLPCALAVSLCMPVMGHFPMSHL